MNCKQGDLAVVVISTAGNEGKIVRCVRLAGECARERADGTAEIAICWETEPALLGWDGAPTFFTADYQLCPIRDNDGQDETLTWAGLPKKKGVEA